MDLIKKVKLTGKVEEPYLYTGDDSAHIALVTPRRKFARNKTLPLENVNDVLRSMCEQTSMPDLQSLEPVSVRKAAKAK